ncbi:MAG: helix-turn-helix domain-containing protein [Calditrichia bacterium]
MATKKKTLRQAQGPKSKTGRPSKYRPEYSEIAFIICGEFGADDQKLAKSFRVSRTTIDSWKKKYPEFLNAIRGGKDDFDTRNVEAALLQRALGFEREEDHAGISQKTGEVVTKKVTKFYPPDPQSIRFWLKNRNPQRWPDRYDVNLGGNLTFRDLTDTEEMTAEELAQAINERLLSQKPQRKS